MSGGVWGGRPPGEAPSGGAWGGRPPGETPVPADGVAADALRELVREVLRDVLPGLAGQPSPPPAVPPTSAPVASAGPPMSAPATPPTSDPVASPAPPASEPAPPRLAGVTGAGGPAPGVGGYGTVSRPGVEARPVRLATDEELHEFVLQVIALAGNPKRRRDLLAGRLRFTLAAAGAPAGQADHRVEKGAVTERAVQAAASAGARLVLGRRAVLTPLARDRARALGVPIEKER
jgi:hypothetical protein